MMVQYFVFIRHQPFVEACALSRLPDVQGRPHGNTCAHLLTLRHSVRTKIARSVQFLSFCKHINFVYNLCDPGGLNCCSAFVWHDKFGADQDHAVVY